MFVREITFAILKTTPLQPLTGDMGDQYANVKPHASVTVAFAEAECDPTTNAGQALMEQAYSTAQDACLAQLIRFHEDFCAMIESDH